MRRFQLLGTIVIAGTITAGCGDQAPVAPGAAGEDGGALLHGHQASFSAASHDINTPGGASLERLTGGKFPHPIDGQFKFRYDGGMQVVRLPDLSNVVMARLTIAEGGSVGWHRHPGSAIIVVESGTFGIIEETDCVMRTYGPGQVAFHRGGGILDVGFNAGTGNVVAYVTFLGVPAGQAPTAPVAPEQAPC